MLQFFAFALLAVFFDHATAMSIIPNDGSGRGSPIKPNGEGWRPLHSTLPNILVVLGANNLDEKSCENVFDKAWNKFGNHPPDCHYPSVPFRKGKDTLCVKFCDSRHTTEFRYGRDIPINYDVVMNVANWEAKKPIFQPVRNLPRCMKYEGHVALLAPQICDYMDCVGYPKNDKAKLSKKTKNKCLDKYPW